MKVCVYGAGAIGSLIAARLSAAGEQVSMIARGKNLAALQSQGVGLVQAGAAPQFYPVTAAADPGVLGVQDLVVVATKQCSVNEVIRKLGPLLGESTPVLLAMNGVPWWFLDGLEQAPDDRVLRCLDPEGDLRDMLPSRQVLGCVLHLSAVMISPGIVQLNGGNTMLVGSPLKTMSTSLKMTVERLSHAGFDSRESTDIHRDIWFKLLGNMTMNPVSALTRATTDRILDDPLVSDFCCRVMTEAAEIGAALGCHMEQTPEERNAETRKLGCFKTSMLQDAEAGRDLEFQALVGVVHELALKLRIHAPNLETLYGLIRLLGSNISTHKN